MSFRNKSRAVVVWVSSKGILDNWRIVQTVCKTIFNTDCEEIVFLQPHKPMIGTARKTEIEWEGDDKNFLGIKICWITCIT